MSAGMLASYAANFLEFWRHETVGIPVSDGVDEVALALTSNAYEATHLAQVKTLANDMNPVVMRYGLAAGAGCDGRCARTTRAGAAVCRRARLCARPRAFGHHRTLRRENRARRANGTRVSRAQTLRRSRGRREQSAQSFDLSFLPPPIASWLASRSRFFRSASRPSSLRSILCDASQSACAVSSRRFTAW